MRMMGVVQARMGSTRLPGKVLRRLGDRRARRGWCAPPARATALDDLVVATTTEPADDAVVVECARLDVAVHRGPVDDVLARFIGAVATRPADAVARFTADCPLLDPEIVAMAGRVFRSVLRCGLREHGHRARLPLGLNVEIVRTEVLHAVIGVRAATGVALTAPTSRPTCGRTRTCSACSASPCRRTGRRCGSPSTRRRTGT